MSPAATPSTPGPGPITPRRRAYIIAASLLALFLGALDALVMAAAMPTVVAELGGLQLYSWVYSIYLLSRAVSLPLFGKSADIFSTKTLYLIAIALFVAGSLAAGFTESMEFLIACRAIQGIGAGGSFALVYVVLTDISSPETRAKSLSLGSFIWGLASVLGPSMGAFIVAHFSWRWIFFLNVPLSGAALLAIVLYLQDIRQKKKDASIDFAGALTLSVAVITLLITTYNAVTAGADNYRITGIGIFIAHISRSAGVAAAGAGIAVFIAGLGAVAEGAVIRALNRSSGLACPAQAGFSPITIDAVITICV